MALSIALLFSKSDLRWGKGRNSDNFDRRKKIFTFLKIARVDLKQILLSLFDNCDNIIAIANKRPKCQFGS